MLRSADFIFRPFTPGDAPDFVDAVVESSSTLAPWMPWANPHYSEAEAHAWIERCQQGWSDRSGFEFGIFDAHSGAFVGGCGLNHFNHLHEFCNLGYWVRQSFHRRGAATQAVRTLARFGFDELKLGRIEIVVGVGNTASLGTARKAGAIEEGVARNRLKLGDGFVDAHMLALVPPLGLASPSPTTQAVQPAQPIKPAEHAVIAYFQYGSRDLSHLHEMEDRLQSAIANAGTGEYDGHEIAVDGSDGVLYMYGPDANALFGTIHPILEATPFMRGAKVMKRYGPPEPASESTTVLIGG